MAVVKAAGQIVAVAGVKLRKKQEGGDKDKNGLRTNSKETLKKKGAYYD